MKGWKERQLEDLLEVQNGHAFNSKQFSQSEGIPLIRIRDINPGTQTVTNYAGDYDRKFLVHEGDMLIGMDGEFRCNIWHGPEALLNQRVCRLQNFTEQLLPRFLYYGINKYLKDIEDHTGFTTVKHLSSKSIKAIKFPLPLLPDQERIVSILDEAFAAIATARANAEKNLINAQELFDSELNAIFSQKGDEWIEGKLSGFCDVRDGTHDSPKYVDSGIPFVTQKNIRKDGLSFSKTKFISESDHASFYKRSNVSHGDILIAMIGVNRGMSCLVDDSRVFSIKNVGLIKATDGINMKFLLYYLKSHSAANYVDAESRGGAQPFIGLKKLREFPVSLPLKDAQNDVVRTLDELSLQTVQLASIYQQKIDALIELKQSILQKAFSGELTAEPEKTLTEARL